MKRLLNKISREKSFYKYFNDILQKYLKPGQYFYDFKYNFFYHENEDISKTIFSKPIVRLDRKRKLINKNYFFANFFSYFIDLYYLKLKNYKIIENSNNLYNSTIIFNKRGRGWKIFDSEHQKSFTVYSQAVDFNYDLLEINLIKKYFNTPIVSIDFKNRIIEENYVIVNNYEKYNHTNNFQKYLSDLGKMSWDFDYIKDTIIVSVNTKIKRKLKDSNYKIDKFKDFLYSQDEIKSFHKFYFFAYIGLNNLLFDDNNYYIIDYSGFKYAPIFLFIFMPLISMTHQNKNMILNYKRGKFDSQLEKINYGKDIKFDILNRDQLFYYYIIFKLVTIKKPHEFQSLLSILEFYETI